MDHLFHLQVTNKVTTELENNLGLKDSTLAEYIIAVANSVSSKDSFDAELARNGAEFPPLLSARIWKLIRRMKSGRVPEANDEKKKTLSILDAVPVSSRDRKPVELEPGKDKHLSIRASPLSYVSSSTSRDRDRTPRDTGYGYGGNDYYGSPRLCNENKRSLDTCPKLYGIYDARVVSFVIVIKYMVSFY